MCEGDRDRRRPGFTCVDKFGDHFGSKDAFRGSFRPRGGVPYDYYVPAVRACAGRTRLSLVEPGSRACIRITSVLEAARHVTSVNACPCALCASR